MVTVCPAMVAVPVRAAVPLFAVAVIVTVPLPLPLVGAILIQVALRAAVQEQPLPAVTLIVALPPAAPTLALAGETE